MGDAEIGQGVVSLSPLYKSDLVAEMLSARGGEIFLARRVKDSWTGGDWQGQERSLYTYAGDGTLVERVEQESNGSAWSDVRRLIYTYADGKPDAELSQQREAGGWIDERRTTYLYTGDDLEQRLEEVWNGASWVNDFRVLVTANANGDQTLAIFQIWNAQGWTNAERYTFTYRQPGQAETVVGESWSGDAWSNVVREVLSYEADLLEQVAGFEWSGSVWVDSYRKSYTYQNGTLSMVTSELWSGTGWEEAFRLLYAYNVDGNRESIVEQGLIQGEWLNITRTRYEYQGATANEQESIPTRAQSLSIYPNPVRDQATLGFSLSRGEMVEWAVFDVAGRRVAESVPQPFGSGAHTLLLETGALPAGVYVVRLRTEEAVATQRLIVVR